MTQLNPENLRAARAILKWGMRDLARESGVAFSTVYLIENGKRSPPTGEDVTAAKLVETFRRHGIEVLSPPTAGARRIAPQS
ncbi:helix-turn-helix transcriptional regulator [Brevundimonas sp.]|uniref:helix-turn-helix transcriptional regulator n=1 Tax=Brevundimonas sp. TaxID=1871086 RepID=UPI003BACB35F